MSVIDMRKESIEKCESKIARYEIYLEAARKELARRQNSLQKEVERLENPSLKKDKSPLMRLDTLLRLTAEKIANHQYLNKVQRNAEYFLEHLSGIKDKLEDKDEKDKTEEKIEKLKSILSEIIKVKEEKGYSGDHNSEHNSKESDE